MTRAILREISDARRERLVRLGWPVSPPVVRVQRPAAEIEAQSATFAREDEERRRLVEAARLVREARYAELDNQERITAYLSETPQIFELLDGTIVRVPWGAPGKAPASARYLCGFVGEQFGFDGGAIMGRSRVVPIVRARHAAQAAVLIVFPTYSLPHIGQIFSRDHTSVLHALYKALGRHYQHAAAAIRERWRSEAEAAIAAAIAVRP